MKTAIYVEDGLVQLVMKPGGEFEKDCLSTFQEKPLAARIQFGNFFRTQGDYVRHGESDSCLILTVRPEETKEGEVP